MGLTNKSTGNVLLNSYHNANILNDNIVIGLSGNPNVGKSTVFNGLTGLNQHTGNWPGKTISNATGTYKYKNKKFILVDIPGTYSLMSNSAEEEIARDFICFGNSNCTVVVVDATCLERNLNLVYQTLEITDKVVVCVNLLDEAKKKKIHINLELLSKLLGVPVVGTCARKYKTLKKLMEAIDDVSSKRITTTPKVIQYNQTIEECISILQPYIESKIDNINNAKRISRWISLKLIDGENTILKSISKNLKIDLFEDTNLNKLFNEVQCILKSNNLTNDILKEKIVSSIVFRAEDICNDVCIFENVRYNQRDKKIDRVLTSRTWGIPIMLLFLGIIFWITLTGANYPTQVLYDFLFSIEDKLIDFSISINIPSWIYKILILGMYRTLAWVIAVMLPPMAIFFPLFTILEDLGYLPRIAFNLDNYFKKACAHGKQALTMWIV